MLTRKKQILYFQVICCMLWMGGWGTVPILAAPTNVLSGGDFETFSIGPVSPMGLNPWTIITSSDAQSFQIQNYDFDGVGPLGTSKSFIAIVGETGGGGLSLSQLVNLSAGVLYSFSANIASVTPQNNADGGTVTARIDMVNLLDSYSFETIIASDPEYTTLSGAFTPLFSGTYLLSIEILRNYQVSSVSPMVYLDDVQLNYDELLQVVPAPGSLTLGGLGLMIVQYLRFGRNKSHV